VQELSDADTLLATDLLGSLLSETTGTGVRKAQFVAYPFGVADERVAAAAAAAGYEVGCMLTFAHFVDEPFRRPRIGLTTKDARLRLAIQVSGFGQAIRRSVIARTARRLRPRRPWLSHSGLPG
jgi:hypothetical protein